MAPARSHFIVDLLAPWADIRLRPMFGGLGAYCGDLFFAIIDEDIVYFKVDDATRGDYETADSEPFSYEKGDKDGNPGRTIINGYWRVPDEVIEDQATLQIWAQKACDVARRKAKPKPAKIVLKGLGPKSLKWLKEIGITSRKDLENIGAVEAFRLARLRFPNEVTLNLLWGLYASLHGVDIKAVTPDIKAHLTDLLGTVD